MNDRPVQDSPWDAALDALLAHLFSATVPESIIERARLLGLDTIGCALAGLRAPAPAALATGWSAIEPGSVPLPMPGSPALATSTAAGLLSTAACWDEACEGLALAHGRPGVPVVAAVAALAVHGGHAMGEALRAIIIGYEVGARLGAVLRIRPGMHVDAGWPALGVAAAVVALAGGSPVRARDAIEIAASQLPFGLYLPVAQGADARNTYLGHAASLGIQAAQSALAGVQAPRGALGQHADLALGMDGTSAFIAADRWLLAEGYLKAWPAVRHVHYGIAAALALRPRLAGGPDAIRQVRLRIYPEATVYCGNRSPVTPIQAQFSLSFGLAAALCEGALEPASYLAPRFDDPALRRIEAMIEIEAVTTFGDQGSRIAELTIETTDGLHHVERIEQISGDPSMPFDASSTRAKFVDYASPTLGEHAGPLADRWLAMAHAAPVSEWWKQVCSSLPE